MGHVVTADWLAQQLESGEPVRVVDARTQEDYEAGHITGAIHISVDDVRETRDGVEGLLLPPEAFAKVVGARGIDHQTRVVVYDDFYGLAASRVAWSLLIYGHPNVSILQDEWAPRPLSTEVIHYPVTTFSPQFQKHYFAQLNDLKVPAADVVVLDVRDEGEYNAGHIDGAILWPWMSGANVVDDQAFRDDVLADLANVGVTPDKPVITYCRSGVRAAHTFWLLRNLGFDNVRNYDGSWIEWEHHHAKQGEVQ